MTLFFTYDGSDLGNTSVRLEDGLQVTSAADGTIASASVKIDDPTGALSLQVLQQFSITETACTNTRLFTGYIYNIRIHRGPFQNGAGRVWELEIADLNFLLHLRVLRGSTAKRALESGNTRLAWLLPAISDLVADNGLVAANPWMFDEADYRGRYPNEVLPDLCVSSSDVVGRIFFVYWDHAAAEAALFLDVPSAAVNSSSLKISNVLADVDESITFAPNIDSEVGIVGEDVFDGVYFTYKGTSIYRQRAATYTTFGLHRDGVFSTDRVGSAATAIRHADQYLDAHSGEVDTITCLVRLPASKVNLLDAGMRVQVKFSHLRGYTSFTWMRVQKRTVILTAGTNEFYDIQFELSTRGRDGLPGGGGGDFPIPSGCDFTLAQSAVGAEPDLAAAPSAGNLLVIIAAQRGTTVPVYTGFSTAESVSTTGSDSGGTFVFYKTADGSEANIPDTNPSDQRWVWYTEWSIAGALGNHSNRNQASAATILTTSIAAGTESLVIAAFQQAQGAMTIALDAGFGLTSLGQSNIQGSDQGPHTVAGYSLSTTGAYAPTATPSNIGFGRPQASVLVAFTCDAAGNPPLSGRWVYGEVASMAGAVGTLDYGYAAGSLKIRVDGVLISPASYTETDPAAGTFTLSWTPDTDETVTCDYQGI